MAANPKFAGGAKDADSEKGKMFIGGLSWETTHDSLMNYFSRYGEVTDCVVMKNPETGRSRGFGFITFSDPANVDLVMQSCPHTLDNRTIDPKPCNPRAAAARVGRRNLNGFKVFLGGLPANLTETDLRNFFSQYGKVTEVVIMYDQEKKKSRGFGFLSFESEESVDRCVSEHYVNINGKQVEVKKAEPRDTRGGGGGGRGGYQGGWDGSGQGGQMGGYQGWGGPGGQGYGYGPQGGYPNWGPPGQWGGYGAPGGNYGYGPQGPSPQGGYGGWGGWGGSQGGQSGQGAAGGWGGQQGGQSGPTGGSGAAAPPGTDGYGARGAGAAGGPPGTQSAAGGAAGAGGPAKPADNQQYGGYSSYGYGTDAGQGYRGYGTGGQDGTGYGAAPGYGNPEGVPPPAGGKGPAGGPPGGGPGPQRGATGYNQTGQAPGYHPYRRM